MKDFLTKPYADHEVVWVHGHPVPPAFPSRPFRALAAAIGLGIDNENTAHVYNVTNALSGDAHIRKFKGFIESDYGRRVIETPIKIEEKICDRKRLSTFTEGTVGKAFYDFMQGENLSETALLKATRRSGIDYTIPNRFNAFCRQVIHFKVTHDLWHILSGYGRDAIGELCLLLFYNQQFYDRGLEMIVQLGRRTTGLRFPRTKVREAIEEAGEISRGTEYIMGADVEAYLGRSLEEVRAELGIGAPEVYWGISDEVKAKLTPAKR